ncbi:MAG: glycosyltransferase, partial [Nocardioides sp.]
YLRRGLRFPTHPLFDLEHYVATTPGAKRHPSGAFGHYLEADPATRGSAVPWLADHGPGLAEWVVAQHQAWRERHCDGEQQAVSRDWLDPKPTEEPGTTSEDVVVVVEAGHVPQRLRESLDSLLAQTHDRWRVVVVDPGLEDCERLLGEVLGERTWHRVEAAAGDRPEALSVSLTRVVEDPGPAAPTWVAFLRSGETWVPSRLARLLAHATTSGSAAVCDVLEEARPDLPRLLLGRGMPAGPSRNPEWTELSRLLARRDLLAEVGVPAPRAGRGWEFELVSRLAGPAGVCPLGVIGVRRRAGVVRAAHRIPAHARPQVEPEEVTTGSRVVLGERLVDWEALAARPRTPGLASVVVPTYSDWQLTSEAVAAVLEAADAHPEHGEVEVVVVDNGCGPSEAAVLASWAERHRRVRVVQEPVNLGFALGCNVGFAATVGDTVVFLNNDTTVSRDWLGPLRAALEDPDVLGAQPLLTFPTGTIQCAGVVVPQPGGLPYPLLQDFPTLDAAHVAGFPLPALTGAALALRASDVVALRGFDPVFLNGVEDVDLCRRLTEMRRGHYVCTPDSRVVHHESRTPGRFTHIGVNRKLYLERWGHGPGDDVAAWRAVGYEVLGHEVAREAQLPRDLRVLVPLLRRCRAEVRESPPRLRWAIKNPAPASPLGDGWGDTHFAAALAAALREQGQDVIVDRRQEHDRRTGRHDDVELALRGLARYRPTRTNVSLCWLISHPEMLSPAEAASYDRVLAASEPWAREQSRRWGIRIDPLLQATDPRLFHPDRAVPDTGHPVLFVGGSRKVARPIVMASVERGLPLSIYGPGWSGLVDRRHLKGDYLANDELGAAYRSAGVVLNDHWDDMREQGFVSNRLFDAAAAGARVITDDVAGLPDAFGRSVQVLRDPADLVRLTSLADPDEVFGSDQARREVATRVAGEHSFAARAHRLVEIAVDVRQRRGFTD